jgi:hypothetical protein
MGWEEKISQKSHKISQAKKNYTQATKQKQNLGPCTRNFLSPPLCLFLMPQKSNFTSEISKNWTQNFVKYEPNFPKIRFTKTDRYIIR